MVVAHLLEQARIRERQQNNNRAIIPRPDPMSASAPAPSGSGDVTYRAPEFPTLFPKPIKKKDFDKYPDLVTRCARSNVGYDPVNVLKPRYHWSAEFIKKYQVWPH